MYTTRQNMIDRYGETELIQLTDSTGVGIIDPGKLDQAIADASAEIDAYLAARYALPLATVPAALTRIAGDIARYHLQAGVHETTDAVKDRYEHAVRFLRSLAKGEFSLVQPTGAPAETVNSAEVDPGRSVFRGGGF